MGAKFQSPPVPLQTSQNQHMQGTQRLVMSAHMQQALHLLQLPIQELEPFIEEQVVLNPLLELSDEEEVKTQEETDNHSTEEEGEIFVNDQDLTILNRLEEEWLEHFAQSEPVPVKCSAAEEKFKAYLEQSIRTAPSLRDQLLQQAHQTFESRTELEIAEILIGYIDRSGFLKTPLSEICLLHGLAETHVQCILSEIQIFEPYGVAASSIQESLLIQLRCFHKTNTLAYRIIRDHYEQFLHNQIPLMQKQLKIPYEQIQEAIEKDIAPLDLHPGSHFSSHSPQIIIPDVTLRQENDRLIVEVERDYVPPLRLNFRYLHMLNDPSVCPETRRFLRHHFFSARWLARNLQQRYSTIERIAQVLTQKQYSFFTRADGKLSPLTMKMVADELNIHESTVARTVSNKYIDTPRGLFPLRTFFTNKYVSERGEDLSSATVRQAILDLIEKEDKKQPLSDEKLSLILKQKGISCARRTIAKYRSALQIANTHQRKKFY